MIERGEVDYTLTRPFSFVANGTLDNDAIYVTIKEPTMAHCDEAIAMKQCVGRLMVEAKKMLTPEEAAASEAKAVENAEKSEESNAQDTVEFLQFAASMYGDGIMQQMVSMFKKMAFNRKSPICLINGEHEFRDASWERLSIDDAIGLACTFAGNFSMPRGAEKKESARRSGSHTQRKAEPVIEIT